MNLRRTAWAGLVSALVWTAAVLSAEAQAPLYNNAPPIQKQNPKDFEDILDHAVLPLLDINLTHVPPSTSAVDADSKFSARAAAAIMYAAHHEDFLVVPHDPNSNHICSSVPVHTRGGFCNEMYFGLAILAMMAYKDYFRDIKDNGEDQGEIYRRQVYDYLRKEQPGLIGTSMDEDRTFPLKPTQLKVVLNRRHGEYDVLLQSYIALYYKYYMVMPPDVRNIILNRLLSVRGPFPYDNSGFYPFLQVTLTSLLPVKAEAVVPETENHTLANETARYLTNQLLYENGDGSGQTHQLQYDNNRNGDGKNKPPLVDWILQKLQDILKSDFVEYNSRPYQNYNMPPLLNLASYAYEARVRLAARMALDYVSAKVAVSNNDLRRSTPYRRRNEPESYGSVDVGDGHLGDAPIGVSSPDPQTAFYAQLAGNTQLFAQFRNGRLEGGYSLAMVHAGIRDYRAPPSIVDLFVNHRRFYQRFHHSAPTAGESTNQFADEVYAGSPSYLISAGGHPPITREFSTRS
jgi:hypothetical protein